MTRRFERVLGELITELANRPIEIDEARVRWCLTHGLSPFSLTADGMETWQTITDDQMAGAVTGRWFPV